MLKWTLILLGVTVALITVVAIVGILLPKGHVATRMVRIRQQPDAIWRALTQIDAFPNWRTSVTAVERLQDQNGLPVWRERSAQGTMTLVTEEFTPPHRLKTRIADKELPFGGTWTWEIMPAPDGSIVRITEDGEIYSPIFRFMARFVFGYTSTMEQYLRSLGKRFNEDVTPIP